jgi:hypothetical protein
MLGKNMKVPSDYAAANPIWEMKLYSTFEKINKNIENHLHQKLPLPSFAIKETDNLGCYRFNDPNHPNGLIILHINLFKQYEWGAAEYVLRHEMAHMIVDKIFKFKPYNCPHGEHFKLAANAVGVSTTRNTSEEILLNYKGTFENPISDKVRKLFNKGYDNSTTREEAEIFISKAQEIMIRHNLTLKDICGKDRLFITRPIGFLYKSLPTWLWRLANILTEYYHVQIIMKEKWINGKNFGKKKYFEIFGEPHNLDVAEYVFDTLYSQAKNLYKKALQEHREKAKTDVNYKNKNVSSLSLSHRMRRFSENSFMAGLFSQFTDRLNKERKITIKKIEAETQMLVPTTNDALLREMYEKEYPHRASCGYSHSLHDATSFSAGSLASSGLHLRQAIQQGNNNGKYLSG